MGIQITEDIKEKVKARADIVEVIGKVIKLTKHGQNHTGICPFHADTAPSLTVSASKGIYTCFACGAHGDVINFVKENEKLSFVEAVKSLAKDYHIELPTIQQTAKEIAHELQRDSVFIVLEESQKTFANNLIYNASASDYVKVARMISDEMVELYKIGYAVPENQLTAELTKQYSFNILLAAGMTGVSEKGYQFDRFRSRITLPYLDLHGRVTGFIGRLNDSKIEAAKYLNSGDTMVFNKGNALFGLFQAKEAISKQNKAYLVEGNIDVVSVAQRGVRNVIAGSGTALTDAQVRLIKRFTNTVVMMYDPDGAGLKASIANAKTFLAHGFDVKAILLPDGKDPDDFAKATLDQDFCILLRNRELDFIDYFFQAKQVAKSSDFDNTKLLEAICDCISVVPDKYLRDRYARQLAITFETTSQIIKERIKPTKELKVEKWKNGFYGITEAVEFLAADDDQECGIVFTQKEFINGFSESPMILVVGTPTLIDIQTLRSKISQFTVTDFTGLAPTRDDGDTKAMILLKNMHKNGFDITVEVGGNESSFCDYYIEKYGDILYPEDKQLHEFDGKKIAEINVKCAEVISDTEATIRMFMMDVYAKKLHLKTTVLEKSLKPFLAKKKDKMLLDNQRLGELGDAFGENTDVVPDYIRKDKVLNNNCDRWQFYPMADKNGRYCSYMFRNKEGGTFTPITDFYMKPLLHVYDNENDDANNKRVIQLCHLDPKLDRYVEWKSGIFAGLPKVHEKLVNEGPYNFFGNMDQYKRIWMTMSYQFRMCKAIRVFGQHPKGFFAFGNAIYHKVNNEYRIDSVDELGLVTHNEENYYSPVFSKIRLSEDGDTNNFSQARSLIYRDIPVEDQLSFADWGDLMNRVYKIGDNGKWAVLFAITCAFRDFIFDNRHYFTALFFIGPTSSGKSEIGESIRNLYMASTTPAFNLNIGSDASFSIILESIRNVPLLLEEYNDKDISKGKFQAMKAATLDGEGKFKVKDVNSKQLDSSSINASIIILGQEAAQQDDGSLSNRCIMCDVTYSKDGDFTEEATVIFDKLKGHEKTGLSNILLQVLELRGLYEKKYLPILVEETKKLKESVRISVTNTEGMTRIVNAVALMTSTCRLIEEFAPHLKLPFSYAEFLPIAEKKVLTQLEKISSTNKLSTYFQAISTLITKGTILIERELKIRVMSRITHNLSNKKTEVVELPLDTKVLYLNFNEIYDLYYKMIGEKDSLSRQSLQSYFESNQSFLGTVSGCRFSWEEAQQIVGGVTPSIAPDGETITTTNFTRMGMKAKTKSTSAYMFNYSILKSLIDIDFERCEEEVTDEMKPEGGLPF